MNWINANRTIFRAAFVSLGMVLVCAAFGFAQDSVPSSVDVYWKATRQVVAPGVSTVVVLDDEIAHAELGSDTIEFAGLKRGDTVALAYVNGSPVSIVVHVIDRPVTIIPPSLLRRQAEMAHGVIASDLQTNLGNSSGFTVINSLGWTQQAPDHSMSFTSQVENNTQFGGHTANLRTAGLNYRTPGFSINVVDFSQSVTGASPEDRINNFSSSGNVELRGAGVSLMSKKNELSLFAGSTVPYYFLSLNATRDVAGFTFRRRQTDRLNFYGGSSYVNIPFATPTAFQRQSSIMENAGFSYRISKGLLVGAQGGMANDGSRLVRGDFSYSSYRLSTYGSAIVASQTFPLMQLQSLFSGTAIYKGEASYRATERFTPRIYYEHTDIKPGLIYRVPGDSDYFSPSFSYQLSRAEMLAFSYIHSRSSGGFTPISSSGNRYDLLLNSQLREHVNNSAEVTVGSVQDPLQINSEDRLTLRDTISFPVKRRMVLLGVEQDRVQPSLLSKLNQEINLLSPALQNQFFADPTGFIDSSNFPPEVKALLAAEQPTGTTLSASTELDFGSKMRLSPTASVTHSSSLGDTHSWSQTFGYSFSYQVRPSLQFRSSLNNLLFWDPSHNVAQRTTLFAVGFQKTFMTNPGAVPFMHRSRVIEGRVFRDSNINGVYNSGELGLPGVEVRLEDGEVAITDELGRYKFDGVSADQHHVSISLTQFRNPIRMTTRNESEVDLIQQRVGITNFGILDFARVMGTVFNDLRFENQRQPDSKGMENIDLLLDNGKEVRKIQTGGAGEFEVDNIAPGDYKLSVDSASMPANYLPPPGAVALHVSPVATVLQDLPIRAIRSIAGTVVLRIARADATPAQLQADTQAADKKDARKKGEAPGQSASDFVLVPISGVHISAGPAAAVTDAQGSFLLRNLPAGDLKVTITPVKPVPESIKIPSGQVKLPAEPVEVHGATIVITNADLAPYLTREFQNGSQPQSAGAGRGEPERQLSKAVSSTGDGFEAQPKREVESQKPGTEMQSPCNEMPSLGELAQCQQQEKLNAPK